MFIKFPASQFYSSCSLFTGAENYFSDNFESKQIDSSWQMVTANWRIGNVQEIRIALAEGGYQ
jgi:hypothetical protein